jgi:hypothetical protein
MYIPYARNKTIRCLRYTISNEKPYKTTGGEHEVPKQIAKVKFSVQGYV